MTLVTGSQSAQAICLRGSSASLVALSDMVGNDPQQALDQAAARLSRAARLKLSRSDIAWLHAIQAAAYDNLSLPDAARSAALDGMEIVPDIRDPAHVELLNEYAYNGFQTVQIDQSIPLVERARAVQPRGSAADICLQATLGHLLRMRDKSGPAVVNMMQAYRASMRPGLEEQRMWVAAAFSILMRYAGDWDQALALNQEGINWSIAKGRTHDLADFRFKGGWIMVKQGRFAQALKQFSLARDLRKRFRLGPNDAYIDLMTCEAWLNLGRFQLARGACLSAERIFAAYNDASRGQARLFLARIAIGQHRPRDALAELDQLSRAGDATSASVNVVQLNHYRAKALAALGRPEEAYANLDRFVTLNARWSQTDGARQAAILRARFETDRETDRNRELQAALSFANEREREQWRRTMNLLLSGGIVILLLGYIVLAERRTRRRLLVVASSDGLTGLLNRTWTTDLSVAILDQALRKTIPVSVTILDLDHFKNVNDTHGHAAGDEVLRQFAQAARAVIRTNDVLGRWGGEEFLLVMPDTPTTGACEIIERLRTLATEVRLPFSSDLRIRFSAGVIGRTTERTLDELVAKADVALYRAKSAGRNTTCLYGAGDIDQTASRPDDIQAAPGPANSALAVIS